MGISLYYSMLYCPARVKDAGQSKVAADTGLMSADLVFKQKVRDRSRALNQYAPQSHAAQPKSPVKSLIFLNFYRRACGERRGIRKHGKY